MVKIVFRKDMSGYPEGRSGGYDRDGGRPYESGSGSREGGGERSGGYERSGDRGYDRGGDRGYDRGGDRGGDRGYDRRDNDYDRRPPQEEFSRDTTSTRPREPERTDAKDPVPAKEGEEGAPAEGGVRGTHYPHFNPWTHFFIFI